MTPHPDDPQRPVDPTDSGDPPSRDATDAEALGHVIKVLRTGINLGRRELAARAGLSYSYLTEIENGTKQASTAAQRAIARALGINFAGLWAATEEWGRHLREGEPVAGAALDALQRSLARDLPDVSPASRGARARQLRWFRDSAARRLLGPQASDEQPSASRERAVMRRSFARLAARDEHLEAVLERMRQVLAGLSEEDRERVMDLAERLVEK